MGNWSINNTTEIELVVEDTKLPTSLQIQKETRGKDILYVLNQPIFLPYDKDLISKVEKGAELSVPYFTKVLQHFLEATLPDILPKDFYTMQMDRDIHWVTINPESHEPFQYAFNLNFKRTETPNIQNLPNQYKDMNIQTSIFLTSEIFHPASNDPITNGFFPRTKDGSLQPVEWVEIRPSYTFMQLPSILSDEDRTYIGEISAAILQTLLAGSHLFFPKNTIHARTMNDWRYPSPTIKVKNSESITINKSREFRDKLATFLIENKEELKILVQEFAEAKKKAGIPSDESLNRYKTEHLHTHFDTINTKLHAFRNKLPADLGFNELFEEETYD